MHVRFLAAILLLCLAAGCGGPPEAQRPERAEPGREPSSALAGNGNPLSRRVDPGAGTARGQAPRLVEPSKETLPTPSTAPSATPAPLAVEPASFAEDPGDVADSASRYLPKLPRLRVDEERAAAAGIRKLAGRHLVLYTDLPAGQAVDELPAVFDRAFPQWCRYFGLDAEKHADWRMTGFLMKEKARFVRTGLLPGSLPPFENGFSRNYELWLYEQPSDYYRRHLVLHEGTHGLMNTLLGGCGPPWYMEGIAELLATHRWADGRLELDYVPRSKEAVPMWGRIRIIQDAYAAGRGMPLADVIAYDTRAHRETEAYAWSWAAALLLDRHPKYRERFRSLQKYVVQPGFNQRFYKLVGDDWDDLSAEWELLVATLQYGHDVARTAVDFTPGRALGSDGARVTVAADRGWQNSGLRLEAGRSYALEASGRYQVADQPQPWPCEPGGVSIRYWQGRPLGMLLAAVRPDESEGAGPLLAPSPVGLKATLSPREAGTLFFRINDSPGELDDNAGTLTVEIRPGS